MSDFDAANGIAEPGCTCIMTRAPRGWGSYNGPEPAEWEQAGDCPVHPIGEPKCAECGAPIAYWKRGGTRPTCGSDSDHIAGPDREVLVTTYRFGEAGHRERITPVTGPSAHVVPTTSPPTL